MKPFIFSNLATSLDGKIATSSREPFYLGTPADRKQMQLLRKRCDALLMGASTLRAYQKFCGVLDWPDSRQPANVIVSRALEGVSPKWPFFSNPALKRYLFVTKKPARLKEFEKTSQIFLIHAKRPAAPQIVKILLREGYRNLLVEGGGGLMWDFASKNLIDEYNVTLTPKIVGGSDSPTLVEGSGFTPAKILELKLLKSRVLGDEIYLTYGKRS
jgi:riboflavin-specific deaminase-like protein